MKKQFQIVLVLMIVAFGAFAFRSNNETGEAREDSVKVGGEVAPQAEPGAVHIILVGINEYGSSDIEGAINDVNDISSKLKAEKQRQDEQSARFVDSVQTSWRQRYPEWYPAGVPFSDSLVMAIKIAGKHELGLCSEIHEYKLIDNAATRQCIKNAIDSIAAHSKPGDTFIFYFAGKSYESEGSTNLMLTGATYRLPLSDSSTVLPMDLLSTWLSLIPCNNQIIISEAGSGEEFANSLAVSLFERNAFISLASGRERTIITTAGLGYELNRDHVNGYLCYYLLQMDDLLKSFVNMNHSWGQRQFEKALLTIEIREPLAGQGNRIYSRVYFEKTFLNLFSKLDSHSRGIELDPLETIKSSSSGRKIALVIATDKYEAAEWNSLRNPINDAKAVAAILQSKYGYEIISLINPKRDSILKTVASLKMQLDTSDEVLVFIAGHGYYNQITTIGQIVPADALPPSTDLYSNSYLSWPVLKSMIDAWPAKNVFVILDVCFGGRFDPIASAVAVPDYANMKSDLKPTEFHNRKTKYFSRLFLASGSSSVPDHWKQSQQHSPFADKLINILNSGKGFLTPATIYQDLQMNITEPVLRSFGRHDAGNGDYVLVPVN